MKTLDNKINKVGDELKANFEKGSKMSIISSYFSIYAFKELKKELSKVEELRFIFTESIFKENTNEKISFSLENINNEELLAGNKYELKLRNELTGLMSIFWTQKVKLFYAALLANNSHWSGVM